MLAFVLSASGCLWVEDTTDLRAFVAQKAAQPGGKIEPLPEFKPYESFVYQGSSLRDPFVPLVMIIDEADPQPDGMTELQPDTNGEVHQVVVGSYMGLDYGVVVGIEERSIALEEIVSNGRGGWMKRPRTVTLPELE